MYNHSTSGAQRSSRSKRVVVMRKISIGMSLLLAACGTPAYRASEVPVPATYDVGTAATVVAAPGGSATEDVAPSTVHVAASLATGPFWTELGDTTLTLLVREAQRANLDVRIAQSRLTSARASRRLAALDLVPTITGTGSTSRSQFSIAQTPGASSQLPSQQLWDVGFDASWELDFFGRVGRNVRGASALAESSRYGLEDVQVSVAAEVARTYFDLRGAQRQLAVSQRNAANQRKIVKLTEDRLAAAAAPSRHALRRFSRAAGTSSARRVAGGATAGGASAVSGFGAGRVPPASHPQCTSRLSRNFGRLAVQARKLAIALWAGDDFSALRYRARASARAGCRGGPG